MAGVLTSLRQHALTWVMACAVAACGGSEIEKATRLVLVTDTDIEAIVRVVYLVTPPEGVPQDASGSIEPGRPAFVVMEKSAAASSGPYEVHVAGLDRDGVEVLGRDAEVWFVAGTTRAALLHLVETCRTKMCEESCGPEGCVPEKLQPDELVDWTGVPPTLQPGSTPDGGADLDGSPGDGDGDGDGDAGGSCTTDKHCIGEALAVCDDGVVVDTMACPASGLCTVGTCVEGMGCRAAPLDDGSECAAGAICHEGECVTGTRCTTNNCSPSCDSGDACTLDCGDVVRCNPSCSTGSRCAVECRETDRCNVTCEASATCAIDCGVSRTTCSPTCEAGSSCEIFCAPGQACAGAVCAGGADCVLHCGDAVSACDFADCADGITNCDDNVVVCGRSCP